MDYLTRESVREAHRDLAEVINRLAVIQEKLRLAGIIVRGSPESEHLRAGAQAAAAMMLQGQSMSEELKEVLKDRPRNPGPLDALAG